VTNKDIEPRARNEAATESCPIAILRSMFPEGRHRNPYFCFESDRDDDGYNADAARAIRCNDVGALRKLHKNGAALHACKRNGESLLHLACHRGSVETIKFLLQDGNIPVNVRDSLGQTVLHDVCWRPPPHMELMDEVLRGAPPELLLAEDVHGHMPFDYAQRGDWPVWNRYLEQQCGLIEHRAALAG